MRKHSFDSVYFRKYYFNAASRVTTAAEMRRRAAVVSAILRHAGIPVRSILDAGCGIGLLRKPFAQVLPRARYRGLEASEYLCARYPWTQGSVVDYAPRSPSDLVICYDGCNTSTTAARPAPSRISPSSAAPPSTSPH